MELNYESVKKILESNPIFSHLFDEFEGIFYCAYNVNGITIRLYNVGGKPDIWLGNLIGNEDKLETVTQFVKIAYQVIYDNIKNKR